MLIKDFFCDTLRVCVFDTRKAMGTCAGEEAALCIKRLLAEKKNINVMFAAAPSQNETLSALLNDQDIDWSRVHAFHMDEYVGLEPSHPAGFRNFLKRAIFDKKKFLSVNLLNGNAENIEKEAMRYAKLLMDHPLDVCMLGIGENGHIAFNDPPVADFNDTTYVKTVELEYRCRLQQVHDGCFNAIEEVPTHALTVTIPGLMQAKHMFCSVPAATKANAVFHMINDTVSTDCPATILKTHACATMYVDIDAGKLIL
ncbi:MAG: glucosamine-6-phosphate deaminase [Clostridia bacterium]|nr:glucosamine-6-phosphate deaminase [Clostridia bacterium]